MPKSMHKPVVGVVYALLLAAVIVTVDLAFFRHRLGARLAANVGLALALGSFYFAFMRRP